MAHFYNDPSRTFSEYLLIPSYSDKDCIPENVSLCAPLVKFKRGEEAPLRLNIPLFSDDRHVSENEDRAVWREFTPQALAAAHEEGRSAIVEFTALWCSNCKINKVMVLNTAEAREIYADKDIVLLTADITNPNPPAQSLLYHLGSRSVPFLAIFPADSPMNPIIMRDLLSKDRYLATLNGLP